MIVSCCQIHARLPGRCFELRNVDAARQILDARAPAIDGLFVKHGVRQVQFGIAFRVLDRAHEMRRGGQIALCGNRRALLKHQNSFDRQIADRGVGAGGVLAREIGIAIHANRRSGEVGCQVVMHRLLAGFGGGGEIAVALSFE